MYLQYLQGGDLVFEHFLCFVEVWHHVLRLSAVGGAQLGEFPLVPLCQLLFVTTVQIEERSAEEIEETLSLVPFKIKASQNAATKKWL